MRRFLRRRKPTPSSTPPPGAMARFEKAWKAGQVQQLIASEQAQSAAANERDPKLRQAGNEAEVGDPIEAPRPYGD